MMREWIIFALCLGAGGHLALAIVLHAPDSWPWPRAGLAGLLMGFGFYLLVQAFRVVWRLIRPASPETDEFPHGDSFLS